MICNPWIFLVIFVFILSTSFGHDNHLVEEVVSKLVRDPYLQKYYQQPRHERLNHLIKAVHGIIPGYTHSLPKIERGRGTEHEFPCKPFHLNHTAADVDHLTPADIKVMGAMGDSLTAGNGILADNILEVLLNYRGYSGTGGGSLFYEQYPTLANILKKYNKNIRGYAIGIGFVDSPGAHLNVAIQGSEAIDMPAQARELVRRIKADTLIDMNNDWKLVNLFVGGNDLCDACLTPGLYETPRFKKRITEALDILYKELPRTFVNVLQVFDVSQVHLLNGPLLCHVLHVFECPCGMFSLGRHFIRLLSASYTEALERLIYQGSYNNRSDFAVVMQPFMADTHVPVSPSGHGADLRYFAPDCFHLSELGNTVLAHSLWDNMLEPVGHKSRQWNRGERLRCPSREDPYFATLKNGLYRQTKQ